MNYEIAIFVYIPKMLNELNKNIRIKLANDPVYKI